jgi:hypothetical protein
MMTQNEANDLIMEIGSMIVNDDRYFAEDWRSLALVGNFSHGQRAMNGYQYFVDGSFVAKIPKSFSDIINQLKSLRETMKNEKGEEWHQCLIHITKPEMKINIQFEYDMPDRWSVKNISLDMTDYAESLKPSL